MSSAIVNAAPRSGQRGIAGRVFVDNEQTRAVVCRGTPGELPNVSAVESEDDCPPD